MSRLTDLIAQAKAKDPQMGADLEREFKALSSRLPFGLNFERHRPEAVELPQRPSARATKCACFRRAAPPRRATRACGWSGRSSRKAAAELQSLDAESRQSTGKVSRGGDQPCHTVINGENYHVLKALTWTHRGKIDAICIDPPYNTGAKDWKYNNDYVGDEDLYRHSKWLAMMERRLRIARELLNPADSVLIVTIDEKEYLRLGLLLEQVFPDTRIQMISSVINPKGATRSAAFGRTDEYLFFVMRGRAAPLPVSLGTEWKVARDRRAEGLRWAELLRAGSQYSPFRQSKSVLSGIHSQ